MSASTTTPSRPACPCAQPHSDPTVPTPRRSPAPPARSTTAADGRTPRRETHPDQLPAPGPADPRHEQYPESKTSPAPLQAAELVLRAGQGNPKAWQEILRRYRGLVFAKVRTFRLQEADALDAVQMTWLRLAENIHRIQYPEHLGGWLATTAARECLHILHHAKRTPTPTDATLDTADPTADPEQHLIDAETAQTLHVLIAELPPRRRKLLRALFTYHPQSYAELSRATGIPLGSIGPTRNRALHQLRTMLENHLTPPA
jgi:RNA polymerase sigma factor (sigma-70 family)